MPQACPIAAQKIQLSDTFSLHSVLFQKSPGIESAFTIFGKFYVLHIGYIVIIADKDEAVLDLLNFVVVIGLSNKSSRVVLFFLLCL